MTADPWATLDDLLGVVPVAEVDEGIGPLAFSGRCSTEDNPRPGDLTRLATRQRTEVR
jgi:hypothetical protein